MTKILLVFTLALAGAYARAELGDIECKAQRYEVTKDGLKDLAEQPLALVSKVGTSITLTADLGDRAYNLSGDTAAGDFLLSQTWGEGYTKGILTTGAFNSSGRLVISQVDGAYVSKLVCTKVLASQFPSE